MKPLSIQKKFVFIVGGSIAVLLFLTAIFVVSNIAEQTRTRVDHDVSNIVKLEAQRIEQFFEGYGRVAESFLHNPFFQDFFAKHDQRGASPSSIQHYDSINQTFLNISSRDDNIKSAFFGTASTGEYFYESETVGAAQSYFANSRQWYKTALEKNRLYVTPPAVDSQDQTVSAVLQSPIYRKGKLIGVGGVDILISTIADVIDKVKYENEGTAFLVGEDQNIVYFPNHSVDLEQEPTIDIIDSDFNDASGFAELKKDIATNQSGSSKVIWKGEESVVVYQRVQLESPYMDWTLAIILPVSIINEPINRTYTASILVSLLIILIITAVTYIATRKITKPLHLLKKAMIDIAEGDGDLTKRIDIKSNDEVGLLASQFNTFIDKLRSSLLETANNTEAVTKASSHLRDVSFATNEQIQKERKQLDEVSGAVSEMTATVIEVSSNAASASSAADEAEGHALMGAEQAQDALNELEGLAETIHKAVDVVSGLGDESDNIGAVVDVINSIAEQTNLLALNAAIEAARAGEQGRGFAVVADEVRTLASRTQESTDDIRRMVERLQNIAQQTDAVMQDGNSKTEQGVEQAKKVKDSLGDLSDSIKKVQEQSRYIAVATEQQTVVAGHIDESLQAIGEIGDQTASHAEELAVEASELSHVAQGLEKVVGQFKIK